MLFYLFIWLKVKKKNIDDKPILQLLFAEDVEFCEKIPWY